METINPLTKKEIFTSIVNRLHQLEKQVQELSKNKQLSSTPLTDLWDNEYDERWNNC
jgi:hypothetical protein|tara:strand:- start:357 stop:527 length:171 start_codon:yes stop_codon:yes gene_type:complete